MDPYDGVKATALPRPTFVILSEFAKVVDQKLYLIGGGIDTCEAAGPESTQLIGVALGFEVPWTATDQPFQVLVRLEDEDNRELPTIGGALTVNVARGKRRIREGQPFLAYFAANLPLNFPSPGTYQIVSRVAQGGEARALLHVFFQATT